MAYWDCPKCAAENSLDAHCCWRCGFQNYGGVQGAASARESPRQLRDSLHKQSQSILEDVRKTLAGALERSNTSLDRLAGELRRPPGAQNGLDPTHPSALVGAWRLVSFESRAASGDVRYPLGRAPVGRLQYDATGFMSVQLMDPGRPQFASGDLTRGSDAELRAAIGGYVAYYGTYTVDPARGSVTHHVEGALFPNWVGGNQVRGFRLDGDRLTITTPPIRVGGEDSTTVLVWARAR
jgi:hypothetical protein